LEVREIKATLCYLQTEVTKKKKREKKNLPHSRLEEIQPGHQVGELRVCLHFLVSDTLRLRLLLWLLLWLLLRLLWRRRLLWLLGNCPTSLGTRAAWLLGMKLGRRWVVSSVWRLEGEGRGLLVGLRLV